MAKRYDPPAQSGTGQFIDSVFLMALVYVALLLPVVLGLTGGETTQTVPEGVTRIENADGSATWEGLTWGAIGQNPTMQAQWEKLGYDLEGAAELVTTRFDYGFKPIPLIVTAVGVIAYFGFMVRISEREYREVIAEKFGSVR